jgi:hypothetical protein
LLAFIRDGHAASNRALDTGRGKLTRTVYGYSWVWAVAAVFHGIDKSLEFLLSHLLSSAEVLDYFRQFAPLVARLPNG